MIAARQIALGGKKSDKPAYWGLCFTAEKAGSTVKMARASTSAPFVKLETSFNGRKWTPFYVGSTTITLEDVGDKVYFRAGSGGNSRFATYTSDYNLFKLTGLVSASGNIMSLIDGENINDVIPSNYCYHKMFIGCTSLVSAPELPATTLTNNCYSHMFNGCTSLVSAPELPATTLATYCYTSMFYGCSGLTSAPELPATTLKTYCYSSMFNGCTSLVSAPELPATTLAGYCYRNMFNGCSRLTSAPELPATTLKTSCYESMFYGCAHLSLIKVNFTAWGTQTNNWVNNVPSTGTFYKPSKLPEEFSSSRIPTGWTVLNID